MYKPGDRLGAPTLPASETAYVHDVLSRMYNKHEANPNIPHLLENLKPDEVGAQLKTNSLHVLHTSPNPNGCVPNEGSTSEVVNGHDLLGISFEGNLDALGGSLYLCTTRRPSFYFNNSELGP